MLEKGEDRSRQSCELATFSCDLPLRLGNVLLVLGCLGGRDADFTIYSLRSFSTCRIAAKIGRPRYHYTALVRELSEMVLQEVSLRQESLTGGFHNESSKNMLLPTGKDSRIQIQ